MYRSRRVLTFGTFNGGNRANIIPDQVVMTGTLRVMSEDRREFMKRRVQEIAEGVANSMGAGTTVEWLPNGYPITVNNPDLTARMVPSLARVVGPDRVPARAPRNGDRGLLLFSQQAPGLFFLWASPRRIRIPAMRRQTTRRCSRWMKQGCCWVCGACCT